MTLFSYRWDVSQLLQITISSPSLIHNLTVWAYLHESRWYGMIFKKITQPWLKVEISVTCLLTFNFFIKVCARNVQKQNSMHSKNISISRKNATTELEHIFELAHYSCHLLLLRTFNHLYKNCELHEYLTQKKILSWQKNLNNYFNLQVCLFIHPFVFLSMRVSEN